MDSVVFTNEDWKKHLQLFGAKFRGRLGGVRQMTLSNREPFEATFFRVHSAHLSDLKGENKNILLGGIPRIGVMTNRTILTNQPSFELTLQPDV